MRKEEARILIDDEEFYKKKNLRKLEGTREKEDADVDVLIALSFFASSASEEEDTSLERIFLVWKRRLCIGKIRCDFFGEMCRFR